MEIISVNRLSFFIIKRRKNNSSLCINMIYFSITIVILRKLSPFKVALVALQKCECCVSCSVDSMDCRPPGFSLHGILQARILEWVAMAFSRASSWPRDQNQVSCTAGRFFTDWDTREALQKCEALSKNRMKRQERLNWMNESGQWGMSWSAKEQREACSMGAGEIAFTLGQ